MKIKLLTSLVLLSACLLIGTATSRSEDSSSTPPGSCPPAEGGKREHFKGKMMERFDTNKDGQLDDSEKAAMKTEMEKHKGKKGGRHGGPGGKGGPGGHGGQGGPGMENQSPPSE